MITKKGILVVAAVVIGIVFVLLAPLPYSDLTTLSNSVTIARPPDVVYSFVTTPANWPRWHPASKAVTGAADHSLNVGERVAEDFVVAGRSGRVVWTVLKRDPPREWMIEGDVDGRKAGVITYALTSSADGTRFQRTFVYPARNLLFSLLNRISIQSEVEAESEQAVQNLKRIVESQP